MQKNAISWFEIPSLNLEKAQQFYESMLQIKMQLMTIEPNECAFFPFDEDGEGVGGAIICGPTAPLMASRTHPGVLIYLYSEHSIEVLLERAAAAGGSVAMPRTELPPGMGFMASILDLDGNIVGLHSLS